MNWEQLSGKWEQFKGEAKRRWGKLTDDDLREVQGQREKLAGKVQERHGMAKEQAEREVDEWAAKQQPHEERPRPAS